MPGILDTIGVGMLGPTIIAHGTEEQKLRHLGPMLHGDEVWCQLFSEPGAGSDLAAVQTRARREDGGGWRLTGQKVWTTNAQHAAYGLLLARTDPERAQAPRADAVHRADGRPGRDRARRCARSPARPSSTRSSSTTPPLGDDAVVGQVDDGWRTALTTLMFERLAIGLGTEGLGYQETRFARALAADEVAQRRPRRAPAPGRDRRRSCWP